MGFSLGNLTHYFSAEARAERATQKMRYNQAVDTIATTIKSRFTSVSDSDSATLREVAAENLNGMAEKMKAPGDSQADAVRKAVDAVLARQAPQRQAAPSGGTAPA